jgi:hypothetical protein
LEHKLEKAINCYTKQREIISDEAITDASDRITKRINLKALEDRIILIILETT